MNNRDFTTIIAVDPGLSGGIACWKEGQSVTAFPMPATEGDLADLVRTLMTPGQTVALIEEVGGFAGKQQPGSAMFRFGRNFGFVLGLFQTLFASNWCGHKSGRSHWHWELHRVVQVGRSGRTN